MGCCPVRRGAGRANQQGGRGRPQLFTASAAQADTAQAHLQAKKVCLRFGAWKVTPHSFSFFFSPPGWDERWPVDTTEAVWHYISLFGVLSFLQFINPVPHFYQHFGRLWSTGDLGDRQLDPHSTPLPAKHFWVMLWEAIPKLANAPGINNAKLFSTQTTTTKKGFTITSWWLSCYLGSVYRQLLDFSVTKWIDNTSNRCSISASEKLFTFLCNSTLTHMHSWFADIRLRITIFEEWNIWNFTTCLASTV